MLLPLYFEYETTDGLQEPVRIFAVDRIAAERTARTNRWRYEDTPQIHALMGYHAVKRVDGSGEGFGSFETWLESLIDFQMTNTIEGDDEDPTPAG